MASFVSRRRSFIAALVLSSACAVAAAAPECATRPVPAEGFGAAVQRNAPAVVQVVVLRGGGERGDDAQGFEFFRPMQGVPLPGGEAVERTFSSGFFIERDGLMLASAHAVFDAREIWVVTDKGARLRAKVLGLERRRDVALLKVDAQGIATIVPASAPLCPGAWVIAMGTPFGFERTVTVGVVSAYPRYLHGSNVPLIQSDVVLNPGSSGGPLLDAEGALVGMNTMVYSSTGIYVGVSFALPVDELMRVADALRRGGAARSGDIGVHAQPLTPELAHAFRLDGDAGALVTRVTAEGPAARAGLRVGDVILGFSRGERLSYAQIEARLAVVKAGTPLELDVWRDGAIHRTRATVRAAEPDALPPLVDRRLANEPRLGLGLVGITRSQQGMAPGLYVDSASGSALLAGLERGDRIVAVNSMPVTTAAEFDAALARAGANTVIALLVERGSTMVYLPVMRANAS